MRVESRLITNPRLRVMEAGRGCWRGRFDARCFEWQLEASSTESRDTVTNCQREVALQVRRESAEHDQKLIEESPL
jgi:hypothetical protein